MTRGREIAAALRPPARLALAAALALLVSLVLASPAAALEQKLTAGDSAASDGFGGSVAIDGNTLVVGAAGDDSNKGSVYVFQRSGDSWALTAKLTATDGAAGDFLGISVAIEGDTIVAGASGDDSFKGSAYTFARTGAVARAETAKLTATDGASNDVLGLSVAIEGDTIVAGAPGNDASKGAAYTFARTGAATRTQTAKLTATDAAAGDRLGNSVAIAGDTIVAGAHIDDSVRGSAYTFARSGAATRTQTAKLTATDAAAGDALGISVAIEGDTIVAGAFGDDSKGSAYTFARTGAATRTQTAKLTATDAAADDQLGNSVAIAGDTIVAGASGDDSFEGSAYTFASSGAAARTETAKLTASDGAAGDVLGGDVAVAGDAIVAGASGDDPVGSATVFFSDTDDPNTRFTRKPRRRTRDRTPTFRFRSDEPNSTFLCKLDRRRFKPCSSPKTLRRLRYGVHRFRVKAIDAAGNQDPVPAIRRFRVVRP